MTDSTKDQAASPNGKTASGTVAQVPKAKKTAKKTQKPESQGAPWTFPKHSLEDAIRVAQAIEEKYAGNPTSAELMAKALGYNSSNWRFLDLLRAANQYGLVSGSGTKVNVELTVIGSDIVAPSSPDQRRNSLRKAFLNVEPFQKVNDFYKGKPLPEDEYFANTVTREFQIQRERVETFIRIYTDNLSYLRSFQADTEVTTETLSRQEREVQRSGDSSEPRPAEAREFLDTCFVLMPFGPWPDRYFKDIYVPAIRDAGFEPIRADGLFNAGSVIEQIWDQIGRAKVLLAELTGKNPNVFYELGLSHAISKPVVFVSGALEDVPFDLRHLRVVTYDTKEPNWGELLRRQITTYLKNAKSEPEKSIPQTFRALSGVSTVNVETAANGVSVL
jgi:hypothetical protein